MLSIDASVIVVILIVWVLVFVLSKLFFNPLRKVMNARKSRIEGDLQASDKAVNEYERRVKEIEDSLKSARAAASETRDVFEKEALKEKEQLIKEMSEQSRAQIKEAQARIDKQVSDIKKELEAESEELAKRIEKKILDQ
ncbi:MAG: ATP synthase F0 subunit B [Acidobacteria bacterium]|nr:ATP synthase F0 subunit B [Acidobacteriota bacterium]MBU1473427.1 ATP synthase F0 subunit B [Acidobacteriota bacterium]MBU4255345.1 ATP synthase F0 subunit B [Acidobacteriota bacterium]